MDLSMTRSSAHGHPPAAYEFGAFRLEPTEQRLICGDQPVPLPHRAFDMLVYLVEHSGHLVTKEELLAALWPGLFVEESNLSQNIFLLRRALTNGASGHEYIETVPRRGYRFSAPVREIFPEPLPVANAAPPPPEPAVARRSRRPAGAILGIGIGLAVLLAVWFWTARRPARPVVGVRSIAVLPLTTLGPPGSDEYLGLGLADAVTTRLGYVHSLLVRPTASVRALNAGLSDPLAAGRALRVDAILAGQIQKADGRIRVTAQLIGVPDGAALWSEKFDVTEADLFTLEDSVSEAVARALVSSLSAGETQRVGRDRPTSPEAYEAYLQGRYFWNQRSEPATRKGESPFLPGDRPRLALRARLRGPRRRPPLLSRPRRSGPIPGDRPQGSRARRLARRGARVPRQPEPLHRLGLPGGGAPLLPGAGSEPVVCHGSSVVRVLLPRPRRPRRGRRRDPPGPGSRSPFALHRRGRRPDALLRPALRRRHRGVSPGPGSGPALRAGPPIPADRSREEGGLRSRAAGLLSPAVTLAQPRDRASLPRARRGVRRRPAGRPCISRRRRRSRALGGGLGNRCRPRRPGRRAGEPRGGLPAPVGVDAPARSRSALRRPAPGSTIPGSPAAHRRLAYIQLDMDPRKAAATYGSWNDLTTDLRLADLLRRLRLTV